MMNKIVGVFLVLAAANLLRAAEIAGTVRDPSGDIAITGIVRDASGDTATVVTDAAWLAATGDSVEIFFKLAGADEEISVATGTVTSVDGKLAKIKVLNATGTIAKDHLARIKPGPGSPQKAPTVSPSPSLTSVETAETTSSVAGDWTITEPDGTQISFSFKADGTFLWVVEDAQYAKSTLARYRIDPSTQPRGIEFFDIEEGEMKGERTRGIFELQSDGRLKLEFPKGPEAPPLKEFTEKAVVLSKATSPVVRPSKPTPPPAPTPTPDVASTPYVAPTPAPDEALVDEAKQRYDRGDEAGAIEALDKAIALNPKNADAYIWRGLWTRTKDETAAIADFEKAMELNPSPKLQELIDSQKAARKIRDRGKLTPTATPERSREKTKRKP